MKNGREVPDWLPAWSHDLHGRQRRPEQGGPASPLTWMSKVCKRTCRCTFAGETMACCEASEHALFLRDLWSSFQKSESGVMDFHLMTDCRSLYDPIHRAGAPKAPSEKRLAADPPSRRTAAMGTEEPWPGADADMPHEGAAPSHEVDVPAEMVGPHGGRRYPEPLEVQQK